MVAYLEICVSLPAKDELISLQVPEYCSLFKRVTFADGWLVNTAMKLAVFYFVIAYSSLLTKTVNIKIYRTIILPVVSYGCETCSITLREECRLRFFESRVLRRIFGPKRDEVTGEWRRLRDEELYAVYSSANIIRVIKIKKTEMGRACSTYGDRKGAYGVLVKNPEGDLLEGPGVNGMIILKWISKNWDAGCMDWIDLAQDRDRDL
jgi:hypothetical protein